MAVNITETPRHTLTVNEQNWNLALTAGPAGPAGATGPAGADGAAGPNSVTSATTSDGTADINFNQVGIGTTNPTTELQLGDSSLGDGDKPTITIFGDTSGVVGTARIESLSIGANPSTGYNSGAWLFTPSAIGREIKFGDNQSNSIGFKSSNLAVGWKEVVGAYNRTILRHAYSPDNIVELGVGQEIHINNTSGNVGIGTANPANLLHLYGGAATLEIDSTTNTANLDFDNTTQTARITLANNYFATLVGGVQRMRILANGNVGIGTTNPTEKLYVAGSIGLNTGQNIKWGSGATKITGLDGSYISFTPNNSEKVRFLSNGNVGIGTTSPSKKLHVVGTGEVTRFESDSSTSTIRLSHSSSTVNEIKSVLGKLTIGADINNNSSNSRVSFDIDGSEKMLIATDGNVGIGTTSPSQKLEVDGAVKKAVFTVNTLPTATAGTSCYVSDSNHTHHSNVGQVVASGGSNFVPVYYDGTDWRIG